MQRRKIFVRKLGKNLTEADLNEYFSKFGPVSTTEILRDANTQKSRRVAYVTFERQEDMEKAISYSQPHLL
jgi:RNA recognition motif-containing protein